MEPFPEVIQSVDPMHSLWSGSQSTCQSTLGNSIMKPKTSSMFTSVTGQRLSVGQKVFGRALETLKTPERERALDQKAFPDEIFTGDVFHLSGSPLQPGHLPKMESKRSRRVSHRDHMETSPWIGVYLSKSLLSRRGSLR